MKLVKMGYSKNPNPTSISVGLSPALLITSWRLLWATRPLFDLGSFCHHHHCHHHHCHYHYCHHYRFHHICLHHLWQHCHHHPICFHHISYHHNCHHHIKCFHQICYHHHCHPWQHCHHHRQNNLSILILFLQPVKCVKSSLVCNTFILFQHWALSDYCHDYCDFQYCHHHHHNSTNNIWE